MRPLRAALIATLLFASCTPPPPPPPTATEILDAAAKKTAGASSLRFALLRTGDPVTLDATTGTKFSEASGEFRAPDRVHAKVKVLTPGAVLTLDFLWLPEGTYATNPFTGAYAKLPAATAFDPTAMLGPTGMPNTLRAEMQKLTLVGKEKVGAADAHHIRGEVDGSKLKALTGGVVVVGAHTVDVWIDAASSYIIRITAAEPGGAAAGWRLELSDFDKPVEIKGP